MSTSLLKNPQSDLRNTGDIPLSAYPELQRLNLITRSRAMVQKILSLFIASPEVRRFREKLSEEERQKALEVRPTRPIYCVYAVESGKTSNYVVVGSVWGLKSYETFKIANPLKARKKKSALKGRRTSN